MDFRIADTFTDSLGRLTAQEQKAAKTTAFDLQMNPSAPGLSFHKLDRAKDTNFWSVRVNADIRLIVHRTPSSLLLTYVDHHDDAYKWAERRKIERHPATGAMQLVEVRERIEEIEILKPKVIEALAQAAKPKLFDNLRKFELMSFGVPEEWIADVRTADEDSLFDVIKHLPQEAQEALLKLAVGEQPEIPAAVPKAPYQSAAPPAVESAPILFDADAFAHPDAQRRFRLVSTAEELQRALDYPWEKWAVFLHPDQTALVERDYSGPVRVSGSAGTGKTIVALHRAVYLARQNPAAKVLLTTFSHALANALKRKIDQLIGNEPLVAERIVVKSISEVGHDLYARAFGEPSIASADLIRSLLSQAALSADGAKFSPQFLFGEWSEVVDAWNLKSWEAYSQVSRLGRKTRLSGKQREKLWAIFELVRAGLRERGSVTWADVFGSLSERLAEGADRPYDFAVVDEAQDIGIAEARFFSALGGNRPNALFFAGDIGQRIFQQPFSWKSLGIDVRGRSHTLRINYRTSHQIRTHADRLLPSSIADVDGNSESRRGTVSVFNGPTPGVRIFDDARAEQQAVGHWIADRLKEGYQPNEIGVFVRSEDQLVRALQAVKAAGGSAIELTDEVEASAGHIGISTMHFAKGLEFRAVAVMACDEDVLPLQERIETVTDDADLEEVYNTERHLLYVACTRARDQLFVTGIAPASEFLGDFAAR
ncbi:3'-5' exonuclease [Methylocella tundrae]|uniref:DNA 3'-5' helicase n=1 Tax=Methylocella tundrae TaxID=227605 RepID=A0A4V6YUK0_METTU|nr:3'-5' exonuclease [Methylocella tundrae]WPP04204.1 3'-5' exonuclease [Methylocella tundrae]VFU10488.1 DNA helicase [Methylocella tundrae]